MHELSIAQSIVDIVRQHAPDGVPVRAVRVAVGRMSGVVPESLEFCFSAVVGDTMLEGARLEIDRIPVRADCAQCGNVFVVEEAAFACPACGGSDLKLISGTELQVIEIEIAEGAHEGL